MVVVAESVAVAMVVAESVAVVLVVDMVFSAINQVTATGIRGMIKLIFELSL